MSPLTDAKILNAAHPQVEGDHTAGDRGEGPPGLRASSRSARSTSGEPLTFLMAAHDAQDAPACAPGGGVTDHELQRSVLPGSLTSWLWRREQVARCSAALATRLGIGVERAEVLLLSEAHRRGLSVGELAEEVRGHNSPAQLWRVARCGVCGAQGRLRVSGEYFLDRVVVCPAGHGVIC